MKKNVKSKVDKSSKDKSSNVSSSIHPPYPKPQFSRFGSQSQFGSQNRNMKPVGGAFRTQHKG